MHKQLHELKNTRATRDSLYTVLSGRIHETCDNDISLNVFLRISRDVLSCECPREPLENSKYGTTVFILNYDYI